jgi:hypothetical protein
MKIKEGYEGMVVAGIMLGIALVAVAVVKFIIGIG